MRTAERSKSKSFYREAVSMTATHVRNGVVSGPADFGWGGPLRVDCVEKGGCCDAEISVIQSV
jgi:hypothetical protein